MDKKLSVKKTNKKKLDMTELTKDYETFIVGKENNDNGKELFEKTIKKAVNNKKKAAK